MSRIIKFRVWNKILKEMLPIVGELSFKGKEVFRVNAGKTHDWLKDGWFSIEGADLKKIVLMQYTGIDDFHGKEIYEGDIVKTGDEQGEVQYDPDQGAYIILLHPHNKKVKSGCYNLASTHPSPIKEIIGNIYETAPNK